MDHTFAPVAYVVKERLDSVRRVGHFGSMNDETQNEIDHIITEEEATRLVDRLLSQEERIARLEAQHQRMYIDLTKEQQEIEAEAIPLLEAYWRANPPRRGKTLRLLTGDVQLLSVPGRWGIDPKHEEEVIAWAMLHLPDAVAVDVRRRARITKITEHIEATGEIPDGVRYTDQHEKVVIKATKKGDDE
jgi:hypothetical protein